MECYEKGIITKEQTGGLELKFGDAEAMLKTLEMIVKGEGELGKTRDIRPLPGPDERGVPRRRAGADAHIVLRVGLEACAVEQVEPIESREPLTREIFAIEGARILEAAVGPQGHLVAPREVAVAHGRTHR